VVVSRELNYFSGNSIIYNKRGIALSHSSSNELSSNMVTYNILIGVDIYFSNNNTLFGNIVCGNGEGFSLTQSDNNTIYFNDIYGNLDHQAFADAINQWDNGTVGNYWGNDYIDRYPTATQDGTFWDIPYEIELYGIDNFPLANALFSDVLAPVFTIIPEDFDSLEGYSGLSVSWTIIDENSMTYSILLDGIEVLSVAMWTSGSLITFNIPNGLSIGEHTITIIASDENGNSVQDTVIFTVNSVVLRRMKMEIRYRILLFLL